MKCVALAISEIVAIEVLVGVVYLRVEEVVWGRIQKSVGVFL